MDDKLSNECPTLCIKQQNPVCPQPCLEHEQTGSFAGVGCEGMGEGQGVVHFSPPA